MCSYLRRGLAVLLVLIASLLVLFLLAEPFLPLPPIWQQVSIGIVLVVHGTFSMFLIWIIQKWVCRFRVWRQTHIRSRIGPASKRDEPHYLRDVNPER